MPGQWQHFWKINYENSKLGSVCLGPIQILGRGEWKFETWEYILTSTKNFCKFFLNSASDRRCSVIASLELFDWKFEKYLMILTGNKYETNLFQFSGNIKYARKIIKCKRNNFRVNEQNVRKKHLQVL